MKKRAIAITLCAFALTGCAQASDAPRHSPQPTPTSTPRLVLSTAKPVVSTPRPTSRISTATGTPYVGMYVSSPPSSWTWQGTDNRTVKDKAGNKVSTQKYRYDTDNNSYTIWVNKENVVVKVNSTRDSSTTSPSPRKKKKPASTPNLSGFSDPEDFYYWYYDDFYDYEEAEDWYYAHGGK